MTDGLERENKITVQELPSALEALLFAHGDPISCDRLSEITQMPKEAVEETLDRMIKDYETNPWGGLLIRKVDDSYVMCTKPSMKPVLERMFAPRTRPPMSQATYETLAVIAYNQPVTRAFVEQIRGVDCGGVMNTLCQRNLIEECGRLDLPGRPLIYCTTADFLKCFCMSTLAELPEISEPGEAAAVLESIKKDDGALDGQMSIL